MQNEALPRTFNLPAPNSSTHFVFRDHAQTLQGAEIKQSDLLDVLTFGTTDFEMWSTFPVSALAIPRRVPAIVISRRRINTYHDCISALYEHAYADACTLTFMPIRNVLAYAAAAKLPGRITDVQNAV